MISVYEAVRRGLSETRECELFTMVVLLHQGCNEFVGIDSETIWCESADCFV